MAQTWVPTLRRRAMLRAVDLLARLGVLKRADRRTKKPASAVRNVLIIEPKNIGDVVLTAPFLARLRSVFPNARTTMLASRFAREIFAGTGLVDEFIDTNLTWSAEATKYNPLAYNWLELLRLRRILPARNFDVAFKCCMHIREHIVIGLSGAGRTVAYAFGIGDSVLTDPINVRDPDRHKVDDWSGLLQPFGEQSLADAAKEPRLVVNDDERRWAAAFLNERSVTSDKRLVGIHPGASVPEKRWPIERFAEIARSLTESGAAVIAFIDPVGYGADLASIEGVIPAKVGLAYLKALIERCALLVCNDSGPMHLAGALGVPTVAVFGSGINRWFAPLGHGHRIISASDGDEATRSTVIPYDIEEVPTGRVLDAVSEALTVSRDSGPRVVASQRGNQS